MTTVPARGLRADAARNAARILHAAREIYAESGPDAPIEAVAKRAEVGERTLYRRFPTKGDLVAAALDQCIAESISPAIDDALSNPDPMAGLTDLIDAAISLAAREHGLLTAARRTGALTADMSIVLNDALSDLASRAQQAGRIRPDIVADDLPRVIAMLHSVLWTMDPAGGGWRRYLAMILDAISTGDQRDRAALPDAPPLLWSTAPSDDWPV